MKVFTLKNTSKLCRIIKNHRAVSLRAAVIIGVINVNACDVAQVTPTNLSQSVHQAEVPFYDGCKIRHFAGSDDFKNALRFPPIRAAMEQALGQDVSSLTDNLEVPNGKITLEEGGFGGFRLLLRGHAANKKVNHWAVLAIVEDHQICFVTAAAQNGKRFDLWTSSDWDVSETPSNLLMKAATVTKKNGDTSSVFWLHRYRNQDVEKIYSRGYTER